MAGVNASAVSIFAVVAKKNIRFSDLFLTYEQDEEHTHQ